MERKYEVEIQKFIPTPEYGSEAFRTWTNRISFAYGMGKPYKNGEEACLKAFLHAIEVSKYSDCVIVSKLENGCGNSYYVKKRNSPWDKDNV